MRTVRTVEIEAISGGDDETRSWGKQLGALISEIKEHPEALLLPPVLAAIYLATRHRFVVAALCGHFIQERDDEDCKQPLQNVAARSGIRRAVDTASPFG